MKATFDGKVVRLGKEGRVLYDQSGYGRPDGEGLRLAHEEALYLLHRSRIGIEGYDFERLLAELAPDPNLLRSFLVYRDLRERGYVVQTGPHDFRVFPRGVRPGTGQSRFMVRVLSERDLVDFGLLVREWTASSHMRKQHLLAIVDDENELTYYEIRVQALEPVPEGPGCTEVTGVLAGRTAIVAYPAGTPGPMDTFGMRLDRDRIILSPLETVYLLEAGCLALSGSGGPVRAEDFYGVAASADSEFGEKSTVYSDLRKKGFVPRTGYKFGHHFRVYSGDKLHSAMLVHALDKGSALPMSTISRSVRLAHSVKKKMLFACVHSTGIQYVEFARIKL
ncbi:MAG: tRNA-intron lyase [Methanoregulaceae archaeon]|nr:tRNA-intron lyase [Methanoregulaceae archaeon]